MVRSGFRTNSNHRAGLSSSRADKHNQTGVAARNIRAPEKNFMALTAQPFADNKALDQVRAELDINVPQAERIGSIAAGAGLVLYGASRRSFGGLLIALLGGALIHRGATGHCALYENLGINSRQLNTEQGVRGDKGIKVVKTITVARSPQEVYRFWRNLENLPRFMEHVESVRELDDRRSAWVVKGPMGHDVEWTARRM